MEDYKESRAARAAHAAAERADSPRTKRKADRANPGRVKLTLYLSAEAKEVLEQLRLRSLDNQGRKPGASDIIEGLLQGVVEKHKATPYPGK